jgi:hypothetical protein
MNYHRPKDLAKPPNVLDAVWLPALEKLPAEEQRDTTLVPAAVSDPGMRAVKCRCSVVCPSADSPIYSRKKSR